MIVAARAGAQLPRDSRVAGTGRYWQVVARIGTSGHDGALLGGASVEDAASLAGLSLRTAYRRLAEPTFPDTLAEAKKAPLARVVEVIAAGSLLAVNTLIELLGSETPPSVRHASAKSILETDERRRQQVEVEDRLTAIEVVGHRVHLFDVGSYSNVVRMTRWPARPLA